MAQFPKSVDVEFFPNFATVRPGDTLVVAINIPRPMTEQEADDIRERLQEQMPGVRAVPVVAAALAVYRPEKDEWLKKNAEAIQHLQGYPEPYQKIYGPGDEQQ